MQLLYAIILTASNQITLEPIQDRYTNKLIRLEPINRLQKILSYPLWQPYPLIHFKFYLPDLLSSAVNPYSILISDNYIYRLNLSNARSIPSGVKLFGGEGETLCCYYYSSPPILQK